MHVTRVFIVLAALIAASWTVATIGQSRAAEPANTDLERFLPNDGNSVYSAAGLLRQWPAEGPKKLWSAEIGWGKSAVVEAGGQAYTAAEIDEKQYAVCLDPATGEMKWKHLLYPEKNRHFAWGPTTSPVVDGDRIYFTAYAIADDVWDMRCPIVCLATDGTELWRADKTFWATEASTPLVAGDTLYVGSDSRERDVLVALDKMTGSLRWSVAVEETPKGRELGAPASLTYQVVDGVPQVIVGTYGTRELLGVHAVTGELMWRRPYPADIIIGLVSTPVAVGSRLFVSGGEGPNRNFSICYQMKAAGGKIDCEEIYSSTELQTNMYNTVAVYRDAVFGFGGNKRAGFLHSTDFQDGRLLWKEESRDWTSEQNLVVADGLMFAITKGEELVMAEAGRDGYRELGRVAVGVDLGRPQQPTIANGRLYLRGNTTVVCYQIAE
jgi:outer membrane protein assembly factor BamB